MATNYKLFDLLKGMITRVTPIKYGGTGKSTIAEARQNLNFIGTNPITSPADDTPANWASLGTGIAYIKSNVLNNQPIQYCFVVNKVYTGPDGGGLLITQTLHALGSGTSAETYIRAGNANGWYAGSANWVKQLNETNGIQMKKLWQNASPTSNYGEQTVICNWQEYDFIEIHGRSMTSSNIDVFEIVRADSGGGRLVETYADNSAGVCVRSRLFTFVSTGIKFALAQAIVGNKYPNITDSIIPVEIYGIKGVQ